MFCGILKKLCCTPFGARSAYMRTIIPDFWGPQRIYAHILLTPLPTLLAALESLPTIVTKSERWHMQLPFCGVFPNSTCACVSIEGVYKHGATPNRAGA